MLYIASCVDCALTGRYVTWLPGAQLQCWMLLTVYTLPQLAVSAKILCLLMLIYVPIDGHEPTLNRKSTTRAQSKFIKKVVICGAVPSMVRSVRLYSQCSHLYVNVFENGTVMARSTDYNEPNLTISTCGFSLELLIHSPVHDMFLCFNRSRLVGRFLTRSQAEKQPNCLFKEEFVDGYNRYHLAKNRDRYIGFNARGLQIRRNFRNLPPRLHKCLGFMKMAPDFDITKHNIERAMHEQQQQRQQMDNMPKWRPQRRLRPSLQNSIKNPCHGVRHNHGRHINRRKNCHGT